MGVTLAAEGVAGRVTRLDLAGEVAGVVDMWSVELREPRLIHLETGVASLQSELAIVCVRIDALPEPSDPAVRHMLAESPPVGSHGLALGRVEPVEGGWSAVASGSLAYAEFRTDTDDQAAMVTRAVASCVAWGEVPIGHRGMQSAWRASAAGAAALAQQCGAKGDTP